MCKKYLLVCCVSLLAFAIFILECTRKIYRPCSPIASVEVINVVINDSLGGNNDGELNPNETIGLLLQLKNIGVVDIPASEGRIFSNQPGINILDSTAAIPEILIGDTVWAVEEFIVMVDNSVVNECAAFLLTLNSDRIAETPFCVPITHTINACLDTCAFLEGKQMASDTIMIRLSICNRSTSEPLNDWDLPNPVSLSGVVVQIPDNSIKVCNTGLTLQNTPVMEAVSPPDSIPLNTLFYATIAANDCGRPEACPISGTHTEEFCVKIPHGTLSTPSCIWFSVKIWTDASRSDTDCIINVPVVQARREMTLYCQLY